MKADPAPPEPAGQGTTRAALRRQLLAEREQFAASDAAIAAQASLETQLAHLLADLEPALLGIYWPVRGEFNAIRALESPSLTKLPLALPFARREPKAMHYLRWDRQLPTARDDYGLLTPVSGTAVVPDVVLVPCVGYTRAGWRLGYGGGFYDRWLSDHPQVTAVGVAWTLGRMDESAWAPAAHDQPLAIVLTEQGVVD